MSAIAVQALQWASSRSNNQYLFDDLQSYRPLTEEERCRELENHRRKVSTWEENKRREEQRKIEAAERRKKRAEAEIIHRRTAEERRQARLSTLQYLAELTLFERWERMCSDYSVTPAFYPVEWLSVSDDELATLPQPLLTAIIDRLRVKCTVPWRMFRKRLLVFRDVHFSRPEG